MKQIQSCFMGKIYQKGSHILPYFLNIAKIELVLVIDSLLTKIIHVSNRSLNHLQGQIMTKLALYR